jgi:serine/threonine-protein kinase RsbW
MTDARIDASPTDTADPPSVRLVIPAQARFLRLVRLTASGFAGDLDYGTDALEDLRIAVDELCAAIMEDAEPDAELAVSYTEVGGALRVEGRCDGRDGPAPELHAVARELLAMLADEYEVGGDDRGRTFRMVKRPRATG